MTEKYYPVILAAFSQSAVRLRQIGSEKEYLEFLLKFRSSATLILEVPTLMTLYKSKMPELPL